MDPRHLVITPISLLQVCLAEPHQLLRMERRHTLGGATAALAVRPHVTLPSYHPSQWARKA